MKAQLSRRSLLLISAVSAGLFPMASNAMLFRGAGGALAPRTFYVSPSGSDGNDGLSPATPWQTITKVNTGPTGGYAAYDYVLFQGSQSFSGGIVIGTGVWSTAHPPTAAFPVTFGSYGTGRPTINSGTVSGFASLNVAAFVLRDMALVGGSQTTTTVDGVHIENSQAGSTKLNFVQLINLDVSQYGRNGINVVGLNAASGFNNVTIGGCSAHDCTGGALAACSGIAVQATNYGSGISNPAHTNVLVTACTAKNNTGKSGHTNWTGSGIFVAETGTGTIQFCETSNNGALSTNPAGPVGCWVADCNNCTIQFCESYDNKTGSTQDGDGFDLDGGCANCMIQYCYSHGNYGSGFQIYSYNDGSVTGSTNCTVRYCISENDGAQSTNFVPSGIMIGNDGATLTGTAVYNNTVYGSLTNARCLTLEGTSIASITGHVANNILYSTAGVPVIWSTSAGNPTGLLFNKNNYFATGAFTIKWNGTAYGSVAAWRTGTSNVQETLGGVNSALNVDPALVSPGTGGTIHGYMPLILTAYKLQVGSPMIGVGLDLLSQFSIAPGTEDYYGNAIPNGTGTGFNVGAYGGNPSLGSNTVLPVVLQ